MHQAARRLVLHGGHGGSALSATELLALVVATLLVVGALWYLRVFERLGGGGE